MTMTYAEAVAYLLRDSKSVEAEALAVITANRGGTADGRWLRKALEETK